jgi:hypothetical protein
MAGLVVVGGEIAAEDGPDADGIEVICGNAADGENVSIHAIGAADETRVAGEGGELGEGTVALTPVEVVGVRDAKVVGRLAGACFDGPNGNELLGVWQWQRLEQNAIDEAVDGGGGADAKGEGENRCKGKARRSAQLAQGKAKIGMQGSEPRSGD